MQSQSFKKIYISTFISYMQNSWLFSFWETFWFAAREGTIIFRNNTEPTDAGAVGAWMGGLFWWPAL